MAKILVVEDDRDIRDLIRMVLEMGGHELHDAATGEDGLAQAIRLRPDAILMDLSLAGAIDGLESTRRLRADSSFDQTPIIDLDLFKEMVERVIAGGRRAGGDAQHHAGDAAKV